MIVHIHEMHKLFKDLNKFQYTCIIYKIKQFSMYEVLQGYAYCERLRNRMIEAGKTLLSEDEYIALLHKDECIILLRTQEKNNIIKTMFFIDDQIQAALSFGIYIIQDDIDFYDVILRCEHARNIDLDFHKYTTSFSFSHASHFMKSYQNYYIQTTMQQALAQHEFKLFIQPKVNIQHHHLSGGEALVRWMHNDHEIPLRDFFPIVDQNAFIRQIDLYIFEEVCIQLNDTIEHHIPTMPISVNVSRPSYEDGNYYLQEIEKIITRYPKVVPYLELEINEMIMYEKVQLHMFLNTLKDMGIRISLDDFGKGNNSLSMLTTLPIDTIKLDQSFFQVPLDVRHELFLKDMIHMLKRLNFHIIAEGIETNEYESLLIRLGCDEIQGFYYYQPMPYDTYKALLIKEL